MLQRLGLLLLCAAIAIPAHGETLYVAASANVEGVNQTRWRTDLQLKAQGDDDAVVTIELLATGADNSDPQSIEVTVEAGHSLRLGNLLDSEFGFSGTAAVRLTVDSGRVAATSRTFNTAADGTYGQTIPAVTGDTALEPGVDGALILLSRSSDPSAGFRTNLGLLNVTGVSIRVEIDLFTADGGLIDTLARTLKPFEHRQLNDVFAMAGATDVADGYALVRTTTETGRLLAYASVVDNGSGDAIFLLAQEETATGAPQQERLVVFESFTRPGCPICTQALSALLDVKTAFQDDDVLIIDQNVDTALAGRVERWFAAYNTPGSVYLPLVMIDSGNQISNGDEPFVVRYSRMIEDALDRPAAARMSATSERNGDLYSFAVRLTNTSGETLSAANGARLTVLLFEDDGSTHEIPFVPAAATTPITTLADGETGDFTLETTAPTIDPSFARWVVIADYKPTGSDSAYDTLQAVQGP